MAKALRCRVGWHKWMVRHDPDVEAYLECDRCGKVMDHRPEIGGVT